MVKTNMTAAANTKKYAAKESDLKKRGLLTPLAAAAAAFLATDVRIGGVLSPAAVSLCAVLSPVNSLAALTGSAAAAALSGGIWANYSELLAAAAMTAYRFILRSKRAVRLSPLTAGIMYFLCICAVSAGGNYGFAMFAAAFFRSLVCWGIGICIAKTLDIAKNTGFGFDAADKGSLFAPAAVYMLFIAALSSRQLWILNPGRITAGFVCAAAARRYGVSGGAAAGVLSAAAFLLCDPSLGRCAALLAFAAMFCGVYMPKGKYAVNAAFICSCFGITAAAGMPSGTPAFIADMGAAAAAYCLVPERLYSHVRRKSEPTRTAGARLSFLAKALHDAAKDAADASLLLLRSSVGREELYESVQSSVCKTFCHTTGCSAVNSEGSFKAAQAVIEGKGSICVKDLPAGFEGCRRKAELAQEYNHAYRIRNMQENKLSCIKRLSEAVLWQLTASCDMLDSFAKRSGTAADRSLSAAAEELFCKAGFKAENVGVCCGSGRLFCEAYFTEENKPPLISLPELTEALEALTGIAAEEPVLFSAGGICRIRWYGGAVYYPDCKIEAVAAEGSVCGDSHISFEDGRGNFYVLLADGMGKGSRAAAASGMAVSLLRRLLLADTDPVSAVRLLNSLMLPAAADEVFSTVDMLSVELFSGKALLIKMGAAPTLVFDKENGIFTAEAVSSPVGITDGVQTEQTVLSLSEDSRIVMTTDGIGSECVPYISSLLENERLTSEQIAEKAVAYADERDCVCDENYRHRDDKTAAAVRLYRCKRC